MVAAFEIWKRTTTWETWRHRGNLESTVTKEKSKETRWWKLVYTPSDSFSWKYFPYSYSHWIVFGEKGKIASRVKNGEPLRRQGVGNRKCRQVKITEYPELGRTHKDHQFQLPGLHRPTPKSAIRPHVWKDLQVKRERSGRQICLGKVKKTLASLQAAPILSKICVSRTCF